MSGIIVDAKLKLVHEAKVDFDADLSQYGIEKGVLTNQDEGTVVAPPAMWLDALNLVLDRLADQAIDFGRVKGLSGAGMQHGTVFWTKDAETVMVNLNAGKSLSEQLKGALAHDMSPNWQDSSTQKECDAFDAELGSPEKLAEVTGSSAHHRFSGPQIMRYRTKYPEHYKETGRISLVSSFLASVFLGKVAPIDIGDVTGMNLWDIHKGAWNDQLVALAAGGKDKVDDLKAKLGDVPEDGGGGLGVINNYFATRYGFNPDCVVIPFTGDNPATILALPLRASDAIVSLGTSTTFLMSTPQYKPDPSYHFMNHPCTSGLYMFMLCYKNGGLAREKIRDQVDSSAAKSNSWDKFNETAMKTPPLSQRNDSDDMRLGLFFPLHETVPNLPASQWRMTFNPKTNELQDVSNDFTPDDARNIVESQMLSLRLRSQKLVLPGKHPETGKSLPAQPRRVYLVGGGSANPAIANICAEVLGSIEGIYKLDIGGNACALGAAYKAVWGCERKNGESFEDLIGSRWDEAKFVNKIADGYREGTFEKYGQAVRGFERMEKEALRREGR